MPELPDIELYVEALKGRYLGQPIERARLSSPFLVRSYDPPLKAIEGKVVRGFRRLGKRIVWELDDDLFIVLHLMVAGRLHVKERGKPVPKRVGLIAFDFPSETLMLIEASKKKRASLYVVRGEEGVAEQDPGGVEPLAASLEAFAEALRRENHTLKRTMTDPHVFSGIGNAYSDEILHRAKLSPIKWTQRVSDDEIARLHACTKTVLTEWVERLRGELKDGFPTKVTAFRPEMAVHGKYKQPCPVCGAPVQRIVRGESEINYCAPCQTGGKLLADRALSRLLRGDWPKTLEELDERKSRHRMAPAATENPAPAKKNAAKKKAPSKKAPSKKNAGPLLLFAHGAGASSASAWMRGWSKRLGRLGKVVSFDYPYMREGRKSPDKADKLIDAHAKALAFARKRHQGRVVLIGKSMGGRMGCHLSLEQQVDALVCLGYPLVSMGKSGKVRDAVLLALTTPVLFVQGTRDRLCPLDRLAKVRKKMAAPSAIHVVDSGDHSLMATKTWLKEQHTTQDAIDDAILEAVAGFLRDHGIGV